MNKRKWISVASKAKEGFPSRKKVASTDFKRIHKKSVDEQEIGSTKILVELQGFWKEKLSHKGIDYDFLNTVDSALMQQVGAPALPQEGIFIAIPDNAVFKELKIINKKEVELEGKFHILPAPKPVFEEEELEYVPLSEFYDSNNLFPEQIAEYVGTKSISGKKVVHIILYLAQFIAKLKKVYALSSIELEISYETPKGMDVKERSKKKMPKHLRNLILDSESISEDDISNNARRKVSRNIDYNILKSPENEANFVIITVESLKDSFETFATIKNYKYETQIVTKSKILEEFPDPNEDVSIRNFLIYAYENWNLPPEYVILGGNKDIIPTHVESHQNVDIPSDHYYADLTGDLCPDIFISRFPASTATDMIKLCDVANYYNKYCDDWRNNELLTTFNRGDYNQCKDDVADIIGNTLNVIKKYDGQATKQEVIDTINAGVGFINYRGHGSIMGWSAGNGLQNTDIPNLNNGNKKPQVLSIACQNNNLDFPGYFGSSWMVNQKAVSFLGASRSSYTTINHSFDKYLWDGIINENLEEVGEIFNWATIKLYQNIPSEDTSHNIYMYLLLGDPTANYKEKVIPTQTTVAYVLMMDTSGSMNNAISTVKIDAKAFIRESRANDQFGVNQFNNQASWIYPLNGNIVTVGADLLETADAATAIESGTQTCSGRTNMGAAIQLGNSMISQATTDEKAFIILSDGCWNIGSDPVNILGNEPPIFIAGLGPYLSREMFEPLLSKNLNSKFYHQPNAWEMMQVFNDIKSLPVDVALTANQIDTYAGSDYKIIESVISEDSEEAQFSVVWSDKRYKYTSGYPSGFNVNVKLIDPNGKTTSDKPVITDEGFCIFNLNNVRPGTWRTLIQYSVPSQVYGTTGSFQFDTHISLDLDAPVVHLLGKSLHFSAKIYDERKLVKGLSVYARIKKPEISIENALTKYKNKLNKIQPDKNYLKHGFSEYYAKLQALRMSQIQTRDILSFRNEFQLLQQTKEGFYKGIIRDTKQAGAYTVEVMVKGTNPVTKKSFSRIKQFSTLVG